MKIQELKLFNGLTEDELQRSLVCSQSNIVEYEKDDYIFSQGERPRWIYMILSGEVLLEQINMAGRQTYAEYLGCLLYTSTYCPFCHVEPICPCIIHLSRRPFRAAPILERTLGSDIQQSRILIPCVSQVSITSFISRESWRSSHSAPRPISLTSNPVFPSFLYRIQISFIRCKSQTR